MNKAMNPVTLKNIKITDPLYRQYIELVMNTVIPYQWDALNDTLKSGEKFYCIENFRIAAGEKQGTHRGAVFQDTDAYKWLEAVAYCIEIGGGDSLVQMADGLIDLIGRAQEPDGYLNTYYTLTCPDKKWSNLTEGHEMYGAGHLIEAAVAYYKATGKDELLQIARKFADLICARFGPGEEQSKGVPGHQEIELALVKLYRVTGEQKYLDLARHFLIQRGKRPNYLMEETEKRGDGRLFPEFWEYDEEYGQTHLPVVEQKTAEGHAVRAMYMYSAMADVAQECGDQEMLEACETLFRNVTEKRMYITGGVGSSGKLERFTVDYDLPNDRMYCESCASVGLMMFGQRMAGITKDARYYDAVERALCNTVLGGMSASGDRYFYVNPLEVWPENCKESTSMSHVKPVRQKWFSCACCPPNIARTLASLGQYIYGQDEESLYVNQFISSDVKTCIGGNELELSMESTYMQDGAVAFAVKLSQDSGVGIRVRMPAYMQNPKFTVDGQTATPEMDKGYAVFAVHGAGEHKIELAAQVVPVFMAADRNVRADVGKVAMMKGPFVYCLEQVDNGENLPSLYADLGGGIMEQPPQEGLPGQLPRLEAKGVRVTQTIQESEGLYGLSVLETQPTLLKALPYCQWCNREPGEMLVWVKAKV